MSSGVLSAALAFILWGIFPLYFRQVSDIPAPEILAHRVLWSLVFLLMLLAARRQWGWLKPLLRSPKVLGAFAASALVLSSNWLIYIWAINSNHVIDASLGYFITPLVNVLLGCTVLHEKLRRAQWVALALAAMGVIWLTLQTGRLPWIALAIGITFGLYGLMRKVATLGALEGLTLETMILAPFAVAALAWWSSQGSGHFPTANLSTNLWLAAAGPITAVPLLLFAAGARQISLTTLGLVQYIGPTIQMAIGIWLFREPFSSERLIGFAFIWAALAVYSAEGWWRARRASFPVVPAA